MKIEVAFTNTGVKHLHHKAIEYDIGIYFEANGHGTVTFKQEAINRLKILKEKWDDDKQIPANKKEALAKFLNLPSLINQAIGDALSDLLFVEAILRQKNWHLSDWDALYKDLPNRLKAVKVNDRRIFMATDAERKLVEPVGLQSQIDDAVKKYENARSFVRPSGTEDVVRVYAEARTQQQADQLAEQVTQLVLAV